MGSNSKSKSTARRARIEEMRRAERARDRRGRILTISVSVIAVVATIGVVSYLLVDASDDEKKSNAEAKAPIAGVKTWDKLGRNHVTKPVSYPMDPPVGGDHNPVWMNCDGDVYEKALPKENAVHSLEHGAVWVTYTDKAPKEDLKALREKVEKTPYSLMSPDPDQAGAIMLTAWGHQLTVPNAADPRVAKFFTKYVQGEQTPEPGAPCTGGKSDPA